MNSNLKALALSILVTISAAISAQTKQVDVNKSSIAWIGKKITGQHDGTVNLKSGVLIFKKGKLAGGNFTVDMASLTVKDIPTGKGKEDLEGHLKDDDFFGTAKFPTANLVFKKIAAKGNGLYTVTGNLTIKGITRPIKFNIATTETTASTKLLIDRTKYGVRYNSANFFKNLGDKTIDNIFELNVILVM